MQLLSPVLLTSFTISLPSWLFTFQALVIFLIGLAIGLMLGRAGRR